MTSFTRGWGGPHDKNEGQGYWISRPLTPEAFERYATEGGLQDAVSG